MSKLIRLDPCQFGDVNSAELANTPKVVARQVDDHQVFCAIFLVFGQLLPIALILFWGSPPRTCPFNGSRFGPALAIELEEALRGGGEDLHLGETKVRAKGGRVHCPEDAIEIGPFTAEVSVEAVGGADLEHV